MVPQVGTVQIFVWQCTVVRTQPSASLRLPMAHSSSSSLSLFLSLFLSGVINLILVSEPGKREPENFFFLFPRAWCVTRVVTVREED
ncbi:hypothetical protein V5799_004516 [Amblyomma americanum]|uniref:Uncharacterized protein n=1 Tax=Amblyomma americanum TaxID=6943 RepID=A0AAQ4D5W2_AMBAM